MNRPSRKSIFPALVVLFISAALPSLLPAAETTEATTAPAPQEQEPKATVDTSGLRPGFWAEWEIIHSPVMDNRPDSLKNNPLKLHLLVVRIENNILHIRMGIDGLAERQILIENNRLDLTALAGDTALRGGFQNPERDTGTFQTESGSIAVEKLTWRQSGSSGTESELQQWISPLVVLGPVYLKNDTLEMKLIRFGQQQATDSPVEAKNGETAASTETKDLSSSKNDIK